MNGFDTLNIGAIAGLEGKALAGVNGQSKRFVVERYLEKMTQLASMPNTKDPGLTGASRFPVSIVCVFNDLAVRQNCLDRSIEKYRGEAPDTEYIPINNMNGEFPTAGAALNYGASLAKHDYLVFVHQDVYLHSLAALEEAAGILASGIGFGLLGAIGVDSEGELVGRIRDRIMLMGRPPKLNSATVVASIDEVLFLVSRDLVQREPLIDTAEFAWHAYAVEYGLRVKSLGLQVGVADIPLTHNSLTTNLARLDVAHAAIAFRYPSALPLPTTCGDITVPIKVEDSGRRLFSAQRWRYRWLRESISAHLARRTIGGGRFVLSDIRQDIDHVLSAVQSPPLVVINLDHYPTFRDEVPSPLVLNRIDNRIAFTSMAMKGLIGTVKAMKPGQSALITNLGLTDFKTLAPHLINKDGLFGYDLATHYWIILGPALKVIPQQWLKPKAIPLGIAKLHL
jgi:Glycosyltransferase like family